MRRYLLDTGIAQDFMHRRNGVLERADTERHQGHRIGICTPVLGELWSGVEGSASRERNVQKLRHAMARLAVWPYDNAAAAEFGRIFMELRRLGRPMQQIDIQIAAIAFTLGNCTVVSKDTDLSAVPGLAVEIGQNQGCRWTRRHQTNRRGQAMRRMLISVGLNGPPDAGGDRHSDRRYRLTLGNCTVVSKDTDLSAVPGLAVENWAE